MGDYGTVRWLLRQNKGSLWRVWVQTACMVLIALSGVAFAVLTSRVVDGAIAGADAPFWRSAARLAAVGVFQILLYFLSRHFSVDIEAGVDLKMKSRLFGEILGKDYGAVSKYHTGVLMSRLNDDIRIIAAGMAEILPGIMGMAVRLIAAFAVVCVIDLKFALAFLVLGVVGMAGASLLRKKLKALHRAEQEATEVISGYMQESLSNLLMLKTFDAEKSAAARADALQNGRKRAIMRRKRYAALMNLLMNTAFYGGYVLGLIWCATKIARGDLSVGMFSAVLQLTGQIERPLTGISGYIPRISAVLSSAERVREIAEIPCEDLTEKISSDVYRDVTEFCIADVTFSYDREKVLDHASMVLKKGEFAVLSGISGIGKSTLMKLVLGVYRPESGSLHMRTQAGEAIPLDCRSRRMFAYVPQGNLLTSGTIRDNICMMRPDSTADEVARALKISCCDDFVDALPDGVDTVIGERGVGISEGQAQRLAIARALLLDAPVLLLDESTSALDEGTEQLLLTNLRRMTDKTCLLISHKKAALSVCDSVYSIVGGKIVRQP